MATLSQKIVDRIKKCGVGNLRVVAWQNPKNNNMIEITRSPWWTVEYPDYMARYITNGHLSGASGGLSLESAGWTVQEWIRKEGYEC